MNAGIAIIAGIVWIVLGIYWLYTIAYVVSKSLRVGANVYFFGILTFFTNFIGVICLWIYIRMCRKKEI